jgi:hypothetical protein
MVEAPYHNNIIDVWWKKLAAEYALTLTAKVRL